MRILKKDFPNITGFSERNLWRMKTFYENYKDFSILPPAVAELPWTHNYIFLEKIKDYRVLEYTEWRNFVKVLNNAKGACKNSDNDIDDHFVEVNKMIEIAKGSKRKVVDYKLSHYACYLIVQDADPRKEVVALGQTYFVIQTRK